MTTKDFILTTIKNNKPEFSKFGIINIGLFGSYVRGEQSDKSDIDILIIGLPTSDKIKRIKEIFVTFNKEVSLKYETEKQFIKNLQKPLYQNILKNNIITIGIINYLKLLDKISVKNFF